MWRSRRQARDSGSIRSNRGRGTLVVGPGAVGLVLHQGPEVFVDYPSHEVVFRVSEPLQVLLRDVDPVAFGVFFQVAQDVGELKGDTHVDGVLARCGVSVAEYLDADESETDATL